MQRPDFLELGSHEASNGGQGFLHFGNILTAAHSGIGLTAAAAAADSADMLDQVAGTDTRLDSILATDRQEGQLLTVDGGWTTV